MTREEQIKQAAEQFADREYGTMREVSVFNLLKYAFKCGAEWADFFRPEQWKCERRVPNKWEYLETAVDISISETTNDE